MHLPEASRHLPEASVHLPEATMLLPNASVQLPEARQPLTPVGSGATGVNFKALVSTSPPAAPTSVPPTRVHCTCVPPMHLCTSIQCSLHLYLPHLSHQRVSFKRVSLASVSLPPVFLSLVPFPPVFLPPLFLPPVSPLQVLNHELAGRLPLRLLLKTKMHLLTHRNIWSGKGAAVEFTCGVLLPSPPRPYQIPSIQTPHRIFRPLCDARG
ncbi:hypothetical protein Pcinc_031147 [Petrolisthes cinctipes]|uniref:Uncharacterized protein n=1 Tax=Petrolisthes cinctipes TaxID=88211 RepID=A0AAE1EX97_PETCI|nr:hypothetical protein Pcinc_031147 [Petrolisthes cinctipes]